MSKRGRSFKKEGIDSMERKMHTTGNTTAVQVTAYLAQNSSYNGHLPFLHDHGKYIK